MSSASSSRRSALVWQPPQRSRSPSRCRRSTHRVPSRSRRPRPWRPQVRGRVADRTRMRPRVHHRLRCPAERRKRGHVERLSMSSWQISFCPLTRGVSGMLLVSRRFRRGSSTTWTFSAPTGGVDGVRAPVGGDEPRAPGGGEAVLVPPTGVRQARPMPPPGARQRRRPGGDRPWRESLPTFSRCQWPRCPCP